MSILSSNLKLLREELSMSIEDLSYRVGISASDIEAYEKGTKIPNASNLIKLCETLRVPYEDVMERDLSEERKTAQQEMKKAYKESKEGEFDWYYGNKKEKRFFIFYMIYFVLGLALAGVAIWFVVTNINYDVLAQIYPEAELPLLKTIMITEYVSSIIGVFGFGAGIFILVDYFKSHTFVFNWWYIFLLSLIISIISIGGAILSIPFLVKSIKKVFLKKRK